MQKETYLTKSGLKQLEAELDDLRSVRRPEVAARIHKASETGGTVDNAEYDEAKKEQAFIEGHILDLGKIINNAEIIESIKRTANIVGVGSTVSVLDQARRKKGKYFIVGSPEAEPSKGKISNVSPIGKALIGKKIGEIAEVKVPAGTITLEILGIK